MNKNLIGVIISMIITLITVIIFIKGMDVFMNIELTEKQNSQDLFIIALSVSITDTIFSYFVLRKILKRK